MLKELEMAIVKTFEDGKRLNKNSPWIYSKKETWVNDDTNEIAGYRFSIAYDENLFKDYEYYEDEEDTEGQD